MLQVMTSHPVLRLNEEVEEEEEDECARTHLQEVRKRNKLEEDEEEKRQETGRWDKLLTGDQATQGRG